MLLHIADRPVLDHLNRLLLLWSSNGKARPRTPTELLSFVQWLVEQTDRFDHMYAKDDLLQKPAVVTKLREDIRAKNAEAVWKLGRKVAGTEPFPPFCAGPFTTTLFGAELSKVEEWCRVRIVTVDPPTGATKPPSKNGRRKNIDARMLKVMAENPESSGWKAPQWAKFLDCSEGTIRETPTWTTRRKVIQRMDANCGADNMDRSGTRPKGHRKMKPKSQWDE